MKTDELFHNLGVEIILDDQENFLKIKETLTRIGIFSKKNNTLTQSVHILSKTDKNTGKRRYRLLHFKELFLLDGKNADFTAVDKARVNTITLLLEQWELLRIDEDYHDIDELEQNVVPMNQIKILAFAEKDKFILQSKYQIGKKNFKKP